MKELLVLHTGGTIAMSETDGHVTPNASNPLMAYNTLFDGKVNLTTEDVFNIPSPHMNPERMLILQQRILKAIKDGMDGIVVTHGTDSLEETAYFLDLTLPSKIPVVVTGAMRSSNEVGSDGLYNFQSAIWTASSDAAADKGVLVVMNDEVHTARFVTKTHTTNVATFRTPTFGPIGLVAKQQVRFFQELIAHQVCQIDSVVSDVFLLKAYTGMDSSLFDLIDTEKTQGLVIEAMGAGNLPPNTLPGIQRLLDHHIPIVLVSRCFNGIAEDVYDYEGGGVQLKKMGVIFCQGLNGQKARIKLLVGLSHGKKDESLIKYMRNAVS